MTNNLNSTSYKKFLASMDKMNEGTINSIFREQSAPGLDEAKENWDFLFKLKGVYIDYQEQIRNDNFERYFYFMNKMISETISFAEYDMNKWHTSIASLIDIIKNTRTNVEGGLEQVWQQIFPFVVRDIKNKEQVDEQTIQQRFEYVLTDSFNRLWIKEIDPIRTLITNLNEQATNIKQTIDNIKSEETKIQFEVTIQNIEDVKKKNKGQIWLWGTLTTASIISIFCAVHYSLEHMNDVFYNSNLLSVSDELKKMYVFKNSLTSLTILGIISFCLVSSLRLLKRHLNINTIYNHKLALLNSFKNLIGEKLFNEQERIKIVEKLVEQIITSDHITLQEQGHSSPSIIQPITEIINGGKQN